MAESAITLTIDPFLLPTTQHRAGLAGLMVLVDTMRRREMGPLLEINRDGEGRYQIELTLESLTAVMNELYAAALEEQTFGQKLKSSGGAGETKEPKRVESVTDEKTGKQKTVYVYDQLVPSAPFLQALGIGPTWLKLWRDAMWSTLRGVPKTRLPFEARRDGHDVQEAQKIWQQLAKSVNGKSKAQPTMDLAGCLMIGAQASHADNVPFQGQPQETLLLHFWPVVMGVFVPQVLDREGKSSNQGFALAVPDVTDYESFQEDFPEYVASLEEQPGRFRPPGAIVALPEEAGLEYAAILASITRARHSQTSMHYSTAGIDVFHLEKRGNSIPLLHSGRIAVSPEILHQYESVRKKYQHPVFRRQLILNVIQGVPWFSGFQDLFSRYPATWFVGAEAKRFQFDIARKTKPTQEVKTDA